LTHREPILDEPDFTRFVTTVEPLLRPSRDVLWVVVGRTESNLPKIRKILAAAKLTFETFYLCYNTKQMQSFGYWRRQRGLANSKSLEIALYCYKQLVPKKRPKSRMYVDKGSSLFNEVVSNVPVLAPKFQAMVSRKAREKCLETMVGIPDVQDEEEAKRLSRVDAQEVDASGSNQPQPLEDGGLNQSELFAAAHFRKRKLYHQVSGVTVPMFPHDNDMELLKELVWEAGQPRWVFHGTPGGGAGLQGCLEMGCSVVALCFDDFHEEQLQKFMLERAVESMVGGHSKVFKDESLMARSAELDLLPPSKAKGRTATALVETAGGTDDLTHPFFKKTKKAAEVKKRREKRGRIRRSWTTRRRRRLRPPSPRTTARTTIPLHRRTIPMKSQRRRSRPPRSRKT